MKGRVGGGEGHAGGAPTDLLVCFPSRAHLTLMPKPICSPSRPADSSKRHPHRPGNRGQGSPLVRTNTKHTGAEIAEPTSPKVNCAGQIKVGPKPRPVGREKDWLSVVEEIERLQKERKRPNWLEALGIKKDVMQFLAALRGLRFNMSCFGSFHGSIDCTTDEEDDGDEDEDDEENEEKEEAGSGESRSAALSKWFMVLEEKHYHGSKNEIEGEKGRGERDGSMMACPDSVPPPNALLLMRCRSAPARGWLGGDDEGGGGLEVTAKMIKEEEKEKERLVLMSYAPDFFKVSTDIVKETWVMGTVDPLARSRSWKS